MPDVATVKAEVQRLLVHDLELNGVKLTPSGGFSFRVDSAEVFVDVFPRHNDGRDGTLVYIYAPVGLGVPATPELFQYVALHASDWIFGHLGVSLDEDTPGVCSVTFRHTLLGDYMDPPEFKDALFGVASTAEELDDKIVGQFGGRRAHED